MRARRHSDALLSGRTPFEPAISKGTKDLQEVHPQLGTMATAAGLWCAYPVPLGQMSVRSTWGGLELLLVRERVERERSAKHEGVRVARVAVPE